MSVPLGFGDVAPDVLVRVMSPPAPVEEIIPPVSSRISFADGLLIPFRPVMFTLPPAEVIFEFAPEIYMPWLLVPVDTAPVPSTVNVPLPPAVMVPSN